MSVPLVTVVASGTANNAYVSLFPPARILMPFVKTCLMVLPSVQTIWKSVTDVVIGPLCASIGRCFSSVSMQLSHDWQLGAQAQMCGCCTTCWCSIKHYCSAHFPVVIVKKTVRRGPVFRNVHWQILTNNNFPTISQGFPIYFYAGISNTQCRSRQFLL